MSTFQKVLKHCFDNFLAKLKFILSIFVSGEKATTPKANASLIPLKCDKFKASITFMTNQILVKRNQL